MKMASGYYLNVFDENAKRDVFLIFNEPNSEPTAEELDVLHDLVERELEHCPSGETLRDAIEESGLECVEFGVQVLSFGLRSRSLSDQILSADSQKSNSLVDRGR